MAIAFADKNPQEDGVFGNLHMLFLFCQERESENSPQPYGGEATGERQHCVQQRLQPISIPSQIECLQAERGKRCVTAAHTDHEKLRNRGDTRTGPSGSVNAAKNPTMNEPLTFTTRVPRGKNSPPRSAMNPDIQKRAPVPSAPPSITKI